MDKPKNSKRKAAEHVKKTHSADAEELVPEGVEPAAFALQFNPLRDY